MRNVQRTSWLRLCLRDFVRDGRGLAAVEFAMVLPLMLVMLFGTVEFSSGVAVDRKVTLIARTLSDLTSQSTSVADSDLSNFFSASIGIMTPYDPTLTKGTLSEIYINSSKVARIQWSAAGVLTSGSTQATLTTSTRKVGDVVTSIVPSALLIPGTYLIFSEVSYTYKPTVGYVMAPAGITLSDVAYTRPRQSLCVLYTASSGTAQTTCPTT
ncbi:pilus assembly protein [Bradyrhizobium sp. ISRA443]|uniref:TadE/TadG family type IV pilus assembly protein n=1 Tax=unclassified Bradyrhizobium TaxID=2631580 RepID=UPI00247AA50A|nr:MULTISPECIES: TadE/TadG family type IV pilus assembly protein [unclassified Bradyrhizobium]WGR94244.1 pilus assembly protein [Bradyrhizobium sp. ISRA435]WGR98937.1 pilus assembly protein [Bradyrhizobium sp. ISRA436]WGS05828.1 pilus assembly protein [Bradyrhizobium sp. ISRA437]WGS12714.1 pilus assembly protein [Bradyrhizobium sp. ISRA443]